MFGTRASLSIRCTRGGELRRRIRSSASGSGREQRLQVTRMSLSTVEHRLAEQICHMGPLLCCRQFDRATWRPLFSRREHKTSRASKSTAGCSSRKVSRNKSTFKSHRSGGDIQDVSKQLLQLMISALQAEKRKREREKERRKQH